MKVNAYAASEAGSRLEPFEYELGELGDNQVDIEVDHCGICHSDLSMFNNEWGMTEYPFVPGHEVVGRIARVGGRVSHLAVGDPVGLGWHAGYCMSCKQCLQGDHNMCATASSTIVGRHGGFADKVRADANAVFGLPGGLDVASAGPLLCGGITVFNPLVQFDICPTAHVGVHGIGGLGHLALKFSRAWGCHVTALTSPGKMDEARQLGAHEVLNSRDPDSIAGAAGRFDLLLSTVNVAQDWDSLVATLRPRGRLHVLGAVMEPLEISVFPLLMQQRAVSGSPVGAPATIASMLEFAARHDIAPVAERFPMSKVNDAMDRLRSGQARYRIILDRD
jgi:alcohol/geraniol dehydrogenase (NADP+)